MRGPRIVTLAATLLLLPGCALLGPGAEPEPEPEHYSGPTAAELTVERVWQAAEDDPWQSVIGLYPDRAVVSDGDRPALAVGVDGREIWDLARPVRFPDRDTEIDLGTFGPSVDGAENPVIAAPYLWDLCGPNGAEAKRCYAEDRFLTREAGIAAFSVENGELLWTTVLEEAAPYRPDERPEPSPYRYRVVSVSRAAVLVERYREDNSPLETVTSALDPRDGSELWSRRGIGADGALGDRVLAVAAGPASADDESIAFAGTPLILDARSGTEVWRGTDPGRWRYDLATDRTAAAYDYAAFHPKSDLTNREIPTPQIVNLRTGQAGPASPGAVIGRDESGPFLAWTEAGFDTAVLTTRGLPDGRPVVGEHEQGHRTTVIAAAGDQLWVIDLEDQERPAVMAVDRTGAPRSERVAGSLRAAGEGWLVTDGDTGLVARRLSS